jgi:hypothetical protein
MTGSGYGNEVSEGGSRFDDYGDEVEDGESHVVSHNPLSSVGQEGDKVVDSDEDVLELDEGTYRASSEFQIGKKDVLPLCAY